MAKFDLTPMAEVWTAMSDILGRYSSAGPERHASDYVAGMVMNENIESLLECEDVAAALTTSKKLDMYIRKTWAGGISGERLVVRETNRLFDPGHYYILTDTSGKLRPGHFITGRKAPPRSEKDGDGIVTQIYTVNGDPASVLDTIVPWTQRGAVNPDFGIYAGKTGLAMTTAGCHQGVGTSSVNIASANSAKTGTSVGFVRSLRPFLTPVVVIVGERELEARASDGPIAFLRHTRNLYDASSVTSQLEQICLTELIAFQHTMRLSEQGEHVVLFLDSLSMLSDALNLIELGGSTRSGGVEQAMIALTRLLIALGRRPEGRKGSVSVILNLLNRGDKYDNTVIQFATATSNGQLFLDAEKRTRKMWNLPPLLFGTRVVKGAEGAADSKNPLSADRTMFNWLSEEILANTAAISSLLETNDEKLELGLFNYEVFNCVLERALKIFPRLDEQTPEGRQQYGAACAFVFREMGVFEGTVVHRPRYEDYFDEFPYLENKLQVAIKNAQQSKKGMIAPEAPMRSTARTHAPSQSNVTQSGRQQYGKRGATRHPLKPQRPSSTN